jgi:hypothetical protein
VPGVIGYYRGCFFASFGIGILTLGNSEISRYVICRGRKFSKTLTAKRQYVRAFGVSRRDLSTGNLSDKVIPCEG